VFLLRGGEQHSEPYNQQDGQIFGAAYTVCLVRRRAHAETETCVIAIRSIEYTLTGSGFESGFLLYKLLRATFPKTYGDRLRFRFGRW